MLSRFESIHADIAAEIALASSGMARPFRCAIFLAYSNWAGLSGLSLGFTAVSPSAILGAKKIWKLLAGATEICKTLAVHGRQEITKNLAADSSRRLTSAKIEAIRKAAAGTK
jgi:hypothetical protein